MCGMQMPVMTSPTPMAQAIAMGRHSDLVDDCACPYTQNNKQNSKPCCPYISIIFKECSVCFDRNPFLKELVDIVKWYCCL